MTKLMLSDQMTAWLSLYTLHSQKAYKTEQLLQNKFFDSKFSLESDERTALWPNGSLTFTLYMTFSNSIPNWTTFVKEDFWFDV